jgi:small subunit ribosomal protein S18
MADNTKTVSKSSSAGPSKPGAPRAGAKPGARPRFAGRPGGPRGRRPFAPRRKVCRFCADKIDFVDFKQVQILRTFMTDRGKILSSRITGTCASHQRQLTRAIKRCRYLALLPFTGA